MNQNLTNPRLIIRQKNLFFSKIYPSSPKKIYHLNICCGGGTGMIEFLHLMKNIKEISFKAQSVNVMGVLSCYMFLNLIAHIRRTNSDEPVKTINIYIRLRLSTSKYNLELV